MGIGVIVLPAEPISGYAIEELQGSPRESYPEGGGLTATRDLMVPWADRLTVMRKLKGRSYVAGGAYVYVSPHAYPEYDKAHVLGVESEPFDEKVTGGGTLASYQKAKLTVKYGTPQFNTQTGEDAEAYVSENVSTLTEFLTLSHQQLYWDAAKTLPLDEAEAPQRTTKMMVWRYTRHRIAAIPPANFNLVGYVNTAAVTSLTLRYTFEAETLLYGDPELDRQLTTDGDTAWSLTMLFAHRVNGGWNRFHRRGFIDPQPIYDSAGAVFKPFKLGAFTQLVG